MNEPRHERRKFERLGRCPSVVPGISLGHVNNESPRLRWSMRLSFMLYPDNDLSAGGERWQSYGLQPLWWPDDETVLLGSSPDRHAQVMLEDNAAEHQLGAGPVFVVDNVDEYRTQHADLEWLMEPCSVPAGRYAIFLGYGGSPLWILDITNDIGENRDLFPD